MLTVLNYIYSCKFTTLTFDIPNKKRFVFLNCFNSFKSVDDALFMTGTFFSNNVPVVLRHGVKLSSLWVTASCVMSRQAAARGRHRLFYVELLLWKCRFLWLASYVLVTAGLSSKLCVCIPSLFDVCVLCIYKFPWDACQGRSTLIRPLLPCIIPCRPWELASPAEVRVWPASLLLVCKNGIFIYGNLHLRLLPVIWHCGV